MATIDEIARRANVSKTTVSFVINNRPGPSAETVAHVRRVMAEMNYVPSLLAQRFASRKSKTVALVVLPYPRVFSDLHHGQMLDAVHETLESAGYCLMLATASPKFIEQQRYSTMLRSGLADGLLLLEPTLDQGYLGELAAADAPVVILNSDGGDIGLDYVRTDDVEVGRLAADHLLRLGHRELGFVAASPNHASARDRARGFLRRLEEEGVRLGERRIFHGSYDTSYWSGQEGCRQILTESPAVTAIFCCNDTMALGAIDAAAKVGRVVPDDLSIIGVDDDPAGTYVSPSLTTVRQPSVEIATLATQTLLDRLTGREKEAAEAGGAPRTAVREALPPALVERDSTAPL